MIVVEVMKIVVKVGLVEVAYVFWLYKHATDKCVNVIVVEVKKIVVKVGVSGATCSGSISMLQISVSM